MSDRIAIIGIGATQFRSISPDVSYKELMYEAAVKAYEDAGIDPRKDVDTFVTCAEDYIEGTSIFDEYTPDQLGAAIRSMHTISQEGLTGLASVYLQLRTGEFGIGVVEAHSKASNMLTPDGITACALDPIYNRPLNVNHHAIAGLEMHRFMYETGITADQCAKVVIKNRKKEIDFAEVDDTFSYKELQHLAAMKLGCGCEMGKWIDNGVTELTGEFPVNPSGGSLGMGHLLDASGLTRVYMAVKQFRGEAGTLQVKNANTALVQAWRGLPTTSGAVAILSN